MLIAKSKLGPRIMAAPNEEGFCPNCEQKLIPKCGEINIWHWAHQTSDCDPWSEGESKWHLEWKRFFGIENCEVSMGNHRADVLFHGTVIELQHSSISPEEISARETFYGPKMIWIFDANAFYQNIQLRSAGKYFSFRWKWPRQSIWFCKRPVFLQWGYSLFQVRKIYPAIPCGGWGYLIHGRKLIEQIKKGNISGSEIVKRREEISHPDYPNFLITNPDFIGLKPTYSKKIRHSKPEEFSSCGVHIEEGNTNDT